MSKYKTKLNNRGFTFVEVLIAIAILVVASVSISFVITTTQGSTTKRLTEADLQQQVVEIKDILHNEILETNVGLKYWAKENNDSNFTLIDADSKDKEQAEKLIAFYNLDRENYKFKKTYYKWDKGTQTLAKAEIYEDEIIKNKEGGMSIKVDENIEETVSEIDSNNEWTVLSNNLETFVLNLKDTKAQQLFLIDLNIEQDDISYPSSDVIYTRNSIQANVDSFLLEKYNTIKIPKPTLQTSLFVYDGQQHAPSELNFSSKYMTRTQDSTISAKASGQYFITYSLKNKDTIMWEDGTSDDVTLFWRISKKAIAITWGETEWIYDGKIHTPTYAVSGTNDVSQLNLSLKNGEIGPNVGEVECEVIVDNQHFEIAEGGSVTLKINPAKASADVKLKENLIYIGAPQSLIRYNSANTVGGKTYFCTTSTPTTPSIDELTNTTCSATDAGDYYVWYYVKSNNPNYANSEITLVGKATIKKSPIDDFIIHPIGNILTYNGSVQTLIIEGSVFDNECVFEYSINGSSWSVDVPSATDAGDYTIRYRIPESKNYSASQEYEINSTIQRRPTARLIVNDNLVYNTVTQNGIQSSQYVENLSGTLTAINAGAYYINATPDKNHAWEDGSETERQFRWTINKAKAQMISNPTAYNDLLMIGSSVTLVKTAGSSTSGIVEFTLDGSPSASYSQNLPTVTTAGSYIVYFRAGGNRNYLPGDRKGLAVEVKPGYAKVLESPQANTLTYNGSAQTLVTAGKALNGNMSYSFSKTGEWSTNLPTKTDAGTYTVYYKAAGTNGCLDSEVKSISVTIKRATGASLSTACGKTWTGKTMSATITSTYVIINSAKSTLSASDAGKYFVYGSPDKNHTWSDGTTGEKSDYWTIQRAKTAKFSISYTKTETGKKITPEITKSYVTINASKSTTSAINPGKYYVYASPDNNHAWSDGTTGEKSDYWTITKKAIKYGDPVKCIKYSSPNYCRKEGGGELWIQSSKQYYCYGTDSSGVSLCIGFGGSATGWAYLADWKYDFN